MSRSSPSASSALSAKSRAALALFTTEWQPCPIRVHIKTLMALINGKHIEWRDRLPFFSPELFQWKINCEFRLTQNTDYPEQISGITPSIPDRSLQRKVSHVIRLG